MKTRVLILAMALLLVAQLAYATVPSPSTEDLYDVELFLADGRPAPTGLVIATIPETPTALMVLEKGPAVLADEKAKIQAVLPVGVDPNALQIKELTTLYVSGYTEDMGDITAKLTFPTKFEPGKPAVVMVGLVQGDQIEWTALPATINADGDVVVTLPSALLTAAQTGNAVIAVLQ